MKTLRIRAAGGGLFGCLRVRWPVVVFASLVSGYAASAATGPAGLPWASVFHRSVELPCTFRFVDGKDGRIESAHLALSGAQVGVSGYVAKVGYAELPAGTRVEIEVIDAQGHTLERKATEFVPARIPPPGRLGQPHSHFEATLDARPPADATIRIAFREA